MLKMSLAMAASGLLLFGFCACSVSGDSPNVYNVKAYGAKGDGVADDAPAIKAAIDAAGNEANNGRPVKVTVPRGTYALATAYGEKQMFSFKGLHNLSIEGEDGTLFLVRDPLRGFIEVADSTNVSFKRIAIDYAPLTFTQFKVLDDGRKLAKGMEFSLELMAGYPDPAMPHLAKGESVIAYKNDGLVNPEAPLLKMKNLIRVDGARYSVTLTGFQGKPEFVKRGDYIVKHGRHFTKNVFRFLRVVNPSLEAVNVYAGPEVFMLAMECENLQLRGCRIAPPEGSGRLLSTSADGLFHVGGRQGPTVEGCYFAGNGDDSINIHHTGGHCYGFSPEGELVVTETPWTLHRDGYKPFWREGERLILMNSKCETVFRARIVSFKVESRNGFDALRVKLAPENGGKLDPGFISSLPEMKTSYKDLICFNIDRCGGNFSIKNNTFTNHRARGVLIQSRSGVIANNKFSHLDGGVMLIGEWQYKDGPLAEDIVIRDNEFRDLGRYISDGAVSISIDGSACRTYEFKNIRIENNTFYNGLDPAIHIDNASDIVIRGNRISYGAGSDAASQLRLGSRGPTRNIVIEDNHIQPVK